MKPPTETEVLARAIAEVADGVRTLAYHVEQLRHTGDELPAIRNDMSRVSETMSGLLGGAWSQPVSKG